MRVHTANAAAMSRPVSVLRRFHPPYLDPRHADNLSTEAEALEIVPSVVQVEGDYSDERNEAEERDV